jgi:hypothetical protein
MVTVDVGALSKLRTVRNGFGVFDPCKKKINPCKKKMVQVVMYVTTDSPSLSFFQDKGGRFMIVRRAFAPASR